MAIASDCQITWDLTLPDQRGEGPFALTNPSPASCPAEAFTDEVAALIGPTDYVLTGTFNGYAVMQLWDGPEIIAFFATEGSGLNE